MPLEYDQEGKLVRLYSERWLETLPGWPDVGCGDPELLRVMVEYIGELQDEVDRLRGDRGQLSIYDVGG